MVNALCLFASLSNKVINDSVFFFFPMRTPLSMISDSMKMEESVLFLVVAVVGLLMSSLVFNNKCSFSRLIRHQMNKGNVCVSLDFYFAFQNNTKACVQCNSFSNYNTNIE